MCKKFNRIRSIIFTNFFLYPYRPQKIQPYFFYWKRIFFKKMPQAKLTRLKHVKIGSIDHLLPKVEGFLLTNDLKYVLWRYQLRSAIANSLFQDWNERQWRKKQSFDNGPLWHITQPWGDSAWWGWMICSLSAVRTLLQGSKLLSIKFLGPLAGPTISTLSYGGTEPDSGNLIDRERQMSLRSTIRSQRPSSVRDRGK